MVLFAAAILAAKIYRTANYFETSVRNNLLWYKHNMEDSLSVVSDSEDEGCDRLMAA
jgi:hypothetical protein